MAKQKIADIAKENKITPHEIIRLLAGEPGAPQTENDTIGEDLIITLKAKLKARRIVRIPKATIPPSEEHPTEVAETKPATPSPLVEGKPTAEILPAKTVEETKSTVEEKPKEEPVTELVPEPVTAEEQPAEPIITAHKKPEKKRRNGPKIIYRPGDPTTTLPPGVTVPPSVSGEPTTIGSSPSGRTGERLGDRFGRGGDRSRRGRDGRPAGRPTPGSTRPAPGGGRPSQPGTRPAPGSSGPPGSSSRPTRPTRPYPGSGGSRPYTPGSGPSTRPSAGGRFRPGTSGSPGSGPRPFGRDARPGIPRKTTRGVTGGYVPPPTKEVTPERRRSTKVTKPSPIIEKPKISIRARLEEKLLTDEALEMIRKADLLLDESGEVIEPVVEVEEDATTRPSRGRGGQRRTAGGTMVAPKPKKYQVKTIEISRPRLLGDFALETGRELADVKAEVAKLSNKPPEVLSILSLEAQQIIAEELDLEVVLHEKPGDIRPRPPIVAVLGHVDHGKTSLLDAFRHTNITAQEAGGITQHIGASVIDIPKGRLTFVDTPGHEAFTAMRARGAQVTDIVVLVVAADDGIMPQTIEAINHALAANVTVIVAINKIDKPDANPQRVRQELPKYGLNPEEWGGTTICVEVSATTGKGVDTLLEMILLQAEILELKADYSGDAVATVIESIVDPRRGNLASVLVRSGMLKTGDNFVVGTVAGRVRSLTDDRGKSAKTCTPGLPVELMGASGLPGVGENLFVLPDEKRARLLAEMVATERAGGEPSGEGRISLDDFFKQMTEGSVKELNLILKGDAVGTLEAVSQAIDMHAGAEVKPRIIHKAVGAITESDVLLAKANKAVVVGFAVPVENRAQTTAETERVEIRTYSIIYELLEDLKSALVGMLEPEIVESTVGRVEIRNVFRLPKTVVAGSFVLSGKVVRGAQVRQYRGDEVIWTGRIESLRRFKEDVKEVAAGYECGIMLESRNDVSEGDILEVYTQEKVLRRV